MEDRNPIDELIRLLDYTKLEDWKRDRMGGDDCFINNKYDLRINLRYKSLHDRKTGHQILPDQCPEVKAKIEKLEEYEKKCERWRMESSARQTLNRLRGPAFVTDQYTQGG